MADDVLATLTAVTVGVLYPSETDAPMEPFVWPAGLNTVRELRYHAHVAAKVTVRAVSLQQFLGELVEEPAFALLAQTLRSTLQGIRVYRCGRLEVTYYVVGTDAAGRLAGIKTRAVET